MPRTGLAPSLPRRTRRFPHHPFIILIARILALGFMAQALLAEPRLSHPSEARQGGILYVRLDSRGLLSEGLISLETPDGIVRYTTSTFPLPLEGGKFCLAAVFGLSAAAEPGTWRLRATGFENGFPFSLESAFMLAAIDFPEEELLMDSVNTEIRTRKDSRTEEETKKLSGIILKFDKFALYLDGPVRSPIGEKARTASFGDRRTYLLSTGGRLSSVHEGVDIPEKRGTPVLASGRGRVVLAGTRYLTGNSIVIEHLPGLYSLYFHLDSLAVEEGEIVEAGSEIGRLGSTGLSTGPHLHWEIRAGGEAVDPDGIDLDKLPYFERR